MNEIACPGRSARSVMIQRDYLMRQVQMLIQAIQEVLNLAKQGNQEAALKEKLSAKTIEKIARHLRRAT